MQIFITDNRYAPGSSHSDLPYDALAAYSARWLDRGSGVPADVLPDRQGIAWDHDQYKVILLGELNQHRASEEVPKRSLGIDVGDLVFDEPIVGGLRFKLWARRSGGYYYVDAVIVREPVDMSRHLLTIDLIDEHLWCDDCGRRLGVDDLVQHGLSEEWEWT